MSLREKVLIIEDELDIAKILSEIITEEGYECIVMNSSTQAQNYLIQNHLNISLVVSDISMPDMSGIEMITHCMYQCGYLPTVLITAHSDFEFTQNAIQLGIIDYILKPFDVTSLISKLPVWIELGRRQREKLKGIPISNLSNKMETLLRISNTKKA